LLPGARGLSGGPEPAPRHGLGESPGGLRGTGPAWSTGAASSPRPRDRSIAVAWDGTPLGVRVDVVRDHRISLKEGGRSTSGLWLLIFLLGLCAVRGRAGLRRRGQGSARRVRPRSGRRSLTATPAGARCSRAENGGDLAAPRGLSDLWSGACSSAGAPAMDRPRMGAVGHPFAIGHGVLRQGSR
jgi:hypothetical protein